MNVRPDLSGEALDEFLKKHEALLAAYRELRLAEKRLDIEKERQTRLTQRMTDEMEAARKRVRALAQEVQADHDRQALRARLAELKNDMAAREVVS